MAIKTKAASIKLLADEIYFHGAREFFDFMSSYYIDFWLIEAMPRKLDGGRGAPIAAQIEWKKKLKKRESDPGGGQKTYFPFKRPFGSKQVLWNLQKLLAYLMTVGKKNIDLHIKESPIAGQYYRTILIDDLEPRQVELLRNWWSGPLAIIETSINNFQTILVVADRYGLNSTDKLKVARALAVKFDGDPGAVATNQLHRFPGSSNNKLTMRDGALPFISKLSLLRESLNGRDGSECIREMLSTCAPAREKNSRKKAVVAAPGAGSTGAGIRDETPSGEAWRWAVAAVGRGLPTEQIELGLLKWVGDHNPVDWVNRTIFNARSFLAESADRYRSPPK